MVMRAGTYFTCEGLGTSEWDVKNSTGQGTFTMYTGLRRSVNTYFAQLERDAGLCNTVKAAEEMGIDVPERDEVGPFTLGATYVSTLSMAAAYATPASGGTYCEPRPVNEILDANGKVLKKYPEQCTRVMSKDVAATVNDILRGVQQPGGFGYNNGTALRIDSAAKTGTTNSAQSVWYVGYTPELAAASMIAGVNKADNPASLVGVTLKGVPVSFSQAGGSSLSGPMWKDAMGVIQDYLSPERFDAPPRRQPSTASSRSGSDDRAGAPATTEQRTDQTPTGGNGNGRGNGNGGDGPGGGRD
jgi:membrane peptidoglycan carboxypeptidase